MLRRQGLSSLTLAKMDDYDDDSDYGMISTSVLVLYKEHVSYLVWL
jgi:hypothetical protein